MGRIVQGKHVERKIEKIVYFQVIDSSDVLVEVIDARDPIGTRCKHVEDFLRKEKPHKHLVLAMNKVDLVPTWVTV